MTYVLIGLAVMYGLVAAGHLLEGDKRAAAPAFAATMLCVAAYAVLAACGLG